MWAIPVVSLSRGKLYCIFSLLQRTHILRVPLVGGTLENRIICADAVHPDSIRVAVDRANHGQFRIGIVLFRDFIDRDLEVGADHGQILGGLVAVR